MPVACKACGAESPDDGVFCEECGQKLDSPAADAGQGPAVRYGRRVRPERYARGATARLGP